MAPTPVDGNFAEVEVTGTSFAIDFTEVAYTPPTLTPAPGGSNMLLVAIVAVNDFTIVDADPAWSEIYHFDDRMSLWAWVGTAQPPVTLDLSIGYDGGADSDVLTFYAVYWEDVNADLGPPSGLSTPGLSGFWANETRDAGGAIRLDITTTPATNGLDYDAGRLSVAVVYGRTAEIEPDVDFVDYSGNGMLVAISDVGFPVTQIAELGHRYGLAVSAGTPTDQMPAVDYDPGDDLTGVNMAFQFWNLGDDDEIALDISQVIASEPIRVQVT